MFPLAHCAERYATTVWSGRNNRRVMDQAAGFRPGHLRAKDELTTKFPAQPVGRLVVHRADEARLVARSTGADDRTIGRVNVLGCGSVGGFVADTVRYARPVRLTLTADDAIAATGLVPVIWN
jgi:hypothetical protein